MKKFFIALLLFALTFNAYAKTIFGTIDYIEGNASIVRSGKSIGEPDFDDEVLADDMIKTSKNSTVIVNLNKNSGMRGTLTIKPNSVAYIRLTKSNGNPKTTIEMMSGQLKSKVSKISGAPTLNVQTNSVAMGVRGTEFSISTSINDSVLIMCTEGEVTCDQDSKTLACKAGSAVECKSGSAMKAVSQAISSPEEFEKKWIADEIEVFKSGAMSYLSYYEKNYTKLLSQFNKAFTSLQNNAVLTKWIKEDSAGITINQNSPTVMKEKKQIMKNIVDIKKVLFTFERIYYRLCEIEQYVTGTSLANEKIRLGLTVGQFMDNIKASAPALESKIYLYRYAEKLYEERNSSGFGFDMDSDWDF